MKKLLFILLLITHQNIYAQKTQKTTLGFELDVFPFATGGYYGSAWLGNNHLRYRAVVAKATTPDFVLGKDFTENRVQAFAGIVDYFFKPEFKGWWIGSGFEYWKCNIKTKAMVENASYSQTVFTVGGGYVWKFYKNFYLNPWAAAHLRLAGEKQVPVDSKVFKPSAFLPEISIKLGWHF